MLPWFCSIIDNTRRQNVVRLICETPGCPLCTTCFYHVLTSSKIYYRADARQHGNVFLQIKFTRF